MRQIKVTRQKETERLIIIEHRDLRLIVSTKFPGKIGIEKPSKVSLDGWTPPIRVDLEQLHEALHVMLVEMEE